VSDPLPCRKADCLFIRDGKGRCGEDHVILEDPLLITVNDAAVTTLMRTPGHDDDLVMGYLTTSGMVRSRDQVLDLSFSPGADGAPTVARVQVRDAASPLEDGCVGVEPFVLPEGRLSAEALLRALAAVRERQPLFAATGAAHAAGVVLREELGDAAAAIVREDIGRHNALDKAIGAAVQKGWRMDETVLLLSGRVGYEIVCKAARAGVGDIAAVGAASSRAIEAARRLGMFLAGFVRPGRVNVYAGGRALSDGL